MKRFGTYTDKDKNAHVVLVVCQHFVVKSPGNNEETGDALPPVRVPVPGKVRAVLFDEYLDSGAAKVAVIPAAAIKPLEDLTLVEEAAPAPAPVSVEE